MRFILFTQISRLLLDFGADPTSKNSKGLTCLHLAAKYGCLEIALLLIARGCDINIRDDYGNNAGYWAREYKHMTLLSFLPLPQTVSPQENREFVEDRDIYTVGWKADELKKYAAVESKKNTKKKK